MNPSGQGLASITLKLQGFVGSYTEEWTRET